MFFQSFWVFMKSESFSITGTHFFGLEYIWRMKSRVKKHAEFEFSIRLDGLWGRIHEKMKNIEKMKKILKIPCILTLNMTPKARK